MNYDEESSSVFNVRNNNFCRSARVTAGGMDEFFFGGGFSR